MPLAFRLSRICVLVVMVALVSSAKALEETDFEVAAAYSRETKGVAVLVMQRGKIVFEDYAPSWNADKPHLLASGTKSFSGAMAVCAVEDGLIALDEAVAETLTEWREDPRKSRITIRQLISLTSGIEGGDNNSRVPSYRDAVALAKAVAEPGTKFSYGPIPFQCFGELLRRKLAPTGESVEGYLRRRVLDPIGLKVEFWRKDTDGNINLPSGASLTAREWVKFGEWVRLQGSWQGRAIVSAEGLAECFKSSAANPAYGLAFWLIGGGKLAATGTADGLLLRTALGGSDFTLPEDTVAAMGKGKNRCYVIPSLELVIVRLGDSVGREFSDVVFLEKLLADSLAK